MSYLDTKEALVELRLPWLGLQQPAETYTQLVDSLLALDNAVSEVLGRVEARVARERQTLQGLEARIDAAAARARKVGDSTESATVVYSAARFPAPKQAKAYERLFYDDHALGQRAEREIEVPEEPPVESFTAMAERRRALDRAVRADLQPSAGGNGGPAQAGTSAIGDYVSDLANRPELAANHPPPPELFDNLGAIPTHVTSVSSTVLFNHRKGVYHDHSYVDNLSGEGAPRLRTDLDVAEEMAEAPQTVRLGDELPEIERIEYSYKPVLGDVPDINVPMTLPNLQNVAALSWLPDLELPGIAPSILPNLIALPATGGDLMSALKERMSLRRKGISGARKDDADGDSSTGDGPSAPPPPARSMTMPTVLPSMAEEPDDAPISMKGMASALKAAESNASMRAGSDDDGDWSD